MRRLTRNGLTEEELDLFDRVTGMREQANKAFAVEMELRDRLLILLHARLSYAEEKIRSLMGVSRYWVRSELSRLRQAGRLLK